MRTLTVGCLCVEDLLCVYFKAMVTFGFIWIFKMFDCFAWQAAEDIQHDPAENSNLIVEIKPTRLLKYPVPLNNLNVTCISVMTNGSAVLPEIKFLEPIHKFSFFFSVRGHSPIVSKYGETVEVPCNKGDIKLEDIMIVKWKYVSIFTCTWSDFIFISILQVWKWRSCVSNLVVN